MRKKYFNMMEDMKGKIRVYARVRPLLKFEKDKGQKEALIIPDELSLEHMWKDKKREYSFDAVFSATTSQDKVCINLSACQNIMQTCIFVLTDLYDLIIQYTYGK